MSTEKFPAIGTLRERVQWQRRDVVEEEEGGHLAIYVPLKTIWARVRPLSTRQMQAGDARAVAASYSVVVRFRSDVKPGDRFVHRGRALSVLSAEDLEGRHAYLACTCAETAAIG